MEWKCIKIMQPQWHAEDHPRHFNLHIFLSLQKYSLSFDKDT